MNLRNTARLRWEDATRRQARLDTWRRNIKALAFGFIATVAVVLAGIHLANMVAPAAHQIESGLHHE